MDLFSVLSMFGGLALFLFGMNAMGDGLEKMSGGKLEGILERLTSNPIKAVGLGAAVTAVIQSSSATTVMVVGFVNSGIMKLSQAIGIIMGANIGTTVTSWILSLSGISSSNFFIKLLKPSSFSPILAIIGVIFLLFSKKEKRKNIGSIMVSFAILMFGMEAMSDAVTITKIVLDDINKIIASVDEFEELVRKKTINPEQNHSDIIKRDIKKYNSKINSYNDKLMELYIDWKNKVITEDEYITLKHRLDDENIRIQNQIEKLNAMLINQENNADTDEDNLWIEDFVVSRRINRLNKELVANCVKRIDIYENNRIVIEYNFSKELASLS